MIDYSLHIGEIERRVHMIFEGEVEQVGLLLAIAFLLHVHVHRLICGKNLENGGSCLHCVYHFVTIDVPKMVTNLKAS